MVLAIFISGCKKGNGTSETKKTSISNIEFSSCTSNLKSTKSDNSCLTIKSLKEKNLVVSHFGTEFCCASEQLDINYYINGDSIVIHEIDKGPFSYCFCEHDLSFQIGPLDYGNYKIKIIESVNSYHRDTLIFEFNHSDSTNFTNCN
jgi:hypothetical protein